MQVLCHLREAARLLALVLLAVSVARLPAPFALIMGFEAPVCEGDCPAADDDGVCPPLCAMGTCAKAISVPAETNATAAAVVARVVPVMAAHRSAPAFAGVFHPPRA